MATEKEAWKAPLSATDIVLMFSMSANGFSQYRIASELGIHQSHVSKTLSRQRWAHFHE